MRICLMIEGQEGVTLGAMAVARDGGRASGARGAVSARITTARSSGASPPARSTPGRRSPRWPPARRGSASGRWSRRSRSVRRPCWRRASSPSTTSRAVGSSSASAPAGTRPSTATYGFPFGTTRGRLDELDASSPRSVRQWAPGGEVWPKPVQQPHPPIIVGGTAKPRTVDAAVRFADEYNTGFPSLEEARDRGGDARGRRPRRRAGAAPSTR